MPTLGEYLSGLGNIGLDKIFFFLAGVFLVMIFLYIHPFFKDVKGFPMIRTIDLDKLQKHLEENDAPEAEKLKERRKEIQKQLLFRILAPIVFLSGLCLSLAPVLGYSDAYGSDFFICTLYLVLGIILLFKTNPLYDSDIKKYAGILRELKKPLTKTETAEAQ